jgi:hypothetical protein
MGSRGKGTGSKILMAQFLLDGRASQPGYSYLWGDGQDFGSAVRNELDRSTASWRSSVLSRSSREFRKLLRKEPTE